MDFIWDIIDTRNRRGHIVNIDLGQKDSRLMNNPYTFSFPLLLPFHFSTRDICDLGFAPVVRFPFLKNIIDCLVINSTQVFHSMNFYISCCYRRKRHPLRGGVLPPPTGTKLAKKQRNKKKSALSFSISQFHFNHFPCARAGQRTVASTAGGRKAKTRNAA